MQRAVLMMAASRRRRRREATRCRRMTLLKQRLCSAALEAAQRRYAR